MNIQFGPGRKIKKLVNLIRIDGNSDQKQSD